jgi:hypothetical protein
MVGNISVSLLMHYKRGRKARNNGNTEVLSPDGKKVMSSWLYYAFKSVLLSHNSFLNSLVVKGLNTVL